MSAQEQQIGHPPVDVRELPNGSLDVFCRPCGAQAYLCDRTSLRSFEKKHGAKCQQKARRM
jgi:hypothetical protein